MSRRDRTGRTETEPSTLARELERDLCARYGPMLTGDDLRLALGYAHADALRRALHRGTVDVPVFSIPRRRGKFALVKDVAHWLAQCRTAALPGKTSDSLQEGP